MDEMLGGLTVQARRSRLFRLRTLVAHASSPALKQEMLEGLTDADIRRMPPFPFPERLFPAGTFPSGMRFSSDFKLPPSVEELLEQNGPEALHALFAAAGSGTSARHRAAHQGAADAGSDSRTDSGSSDWHTDDEQSDTDDDVVTHVRCDKMRGYACVCMSTDKYQPVLAATRRAKLRSARAALPLHRVPTPRLGAAGSKPRAQASWVSCRNCCPAHPSYGRIADLA